MKKLLIVAPHAGLLERVLGHSLFFSECPDNSFLYEGGLNPYDKVLLYIEEFKFKKFEFLETEHFYKLRVWEE